MNGFLKLTLTVALTLGGIWADGLAAKGKIDLSDVKGKWEAYGLVVVDNPCKGVRQALVAYGNNTRGTAYALFELSRLMGVSPYVWWADVLPEKRESLYALPGATVVGEPSVRFRGIFINDEDWGLSPVWMIVSDFTENAIWRLHFSEKV